MTSETLRSHEAVYERREQSSNRVVRPCGARRRRDGERCPSEDTNRRRARYYSDEEPMVSVRIAFPSCR